MAVIRVGPFDVELEPGTLAAAAESSMVLALRNTGAQRCEQIYVSLRSVVVHATRKDWFVSQLGPQEEWTVGFDARLMTREPKLVRVPLRLSWKDADGSHQSTGDFDLALLSPPALQAESPPRRRVEARAPASSILLLRRSLQRLDEVQIETLCLDHFPEVVAQFREGLVREGKVALLLDTCCRSPANRGHLETLLERGEF
ncbi:MAG: hypothetical protein JW892_04420 [Anaerolineae bacterium]|nr:hypothetical protein [Anaerolineae bacterium]